MTDPSRSDKPSEVNTDASHALFPFFSEDHHAPTANLSESEVDAALPRDLPALDRLLQQERLIELALQYGRKLVVSTARVVLEERRVAARAGQLSRHAAHSDALTTDIAARVHERLQPRMRSMLNLTGTVIHTNLGRAPLAEVAIEYTAALMRTACNLEYDLESGQRGQRDSIVEGLLCELTGAQAATVVNNNAAAVLLTLAACASGKEVIVSRGELIEIGGAFRMPDVMKSAGVKLVEVGTTNRTHLADYEQAIGPETALLMKVHTSNFVVKGFTSAVHEAQLAELARAKGITLISDLGSGALIDMAAHGLPAEPKPGDMLSVGVDVVTFSGDKLLGGPQAGLIVGRRELIDRINRHPLKRALRLSKLPLAALEATLRLYQQPQRLTQDLPTLRLLTRPLADIEAAAVVACKPLAQVLEPYFSVRVAPMQGQIGSGALPVDLLPSVGLVIEPISPARVNNSSSLGAQLQALCAALRALPVPIIGRIAQGGLMLDCRCLENPGELIAQLIYLPNSLSLQFSKLRQSAP
jgi:L-seryl-tRNA(Ser) seleniumtransferase